MRSNHPAWLILPALILMVGLWRLFDLRFAAGDIYPPFSSLRTDQQGTRALYESIAELPGYVSARNYRPVERIEGRDQTVFILGVAPREFEHADDQDLGKLENLARTGARLVIGFRQVSAERSEAAGDKTPLEMRWKVAFAYRKTAATGGTRRTALMLRPSGDEWHAKVEYAAAQTLLERNFGPGSIVLMTQSYPLSNEALQRARQPELLAWLIGPNRKVVFDEFHLGVSETSSVSMLARRYQLEPLMAALTALALLFIWRNSTSFLPPRQEPEGARGLTSAKDAASGLANLLRRNIPTSNLIAACLAEWERDQAGIPRSGGKLERVREAAAHPGDPAARYREISAILERRA